MKPLSLAAFITLLLLISPVQAAPNNDHKEISQQEAVSISQKNNPGRVLNVRRNGSVYKVKMLAENGDVRIIRVDAQSGRIINGR